MLSKRVAFFAAILAASSLLSQVSTPQPQLNRVRADLDFLTSDVLGGRASLTPQADIAARYIAAEFQKAGLQPANNDSYLQSFPMVAYRSDPKSRGLSLIRDGESKAFTPGSDFTGAFSRDVHLKAPVVFVGYGVTAPEYNYDDYAHLDVAGKIVLLLDHEPQETNPASVFNGVGNTLHAGHAIKVANARSHGAVAVIIGNDPLHHPSAVFGNNRNVPARPSSRANAPPQSLDDPANIPVFTISDDLLNSLLEPAGITAAQLQTAIDESLQPHSLPLPGTAVQLTLANAEQHRGNSLNVAGLLEGSDPQLKSETIVLTAHYDHLGFQNGQLYPGANDNGSGTAGVIELAKLFAENHVRLKRSLLFIVFGSEEQLMMGSFYYTAHPLRPLNTTRAVINLDMVGRDEAHIAQDEGGLQIPPDTANEINLVGSFYSSDLRSIIQGANRQVGLTLTTKFDADRTLNVLFRCDHLPFLAAGIPAVWLFGGFHPGYHEPVDTVDKLNFPKIGKVIELAYLSAAQLADSQSAPKFSVKGR